jgi:hypothetical protein
MIKNLNRAAIEVKDIQIPVSDKINSAQGLALEIGKAPLIWYNGLVIPRNMISSFELNTDGFFPVLKLFFMDSLSIMNNEAMALDNSIISIYIDSRTKDYGSSTILTPIRMDFKIVDYAYLDDENLYYIQGYPNVDNLYLNDIKSYKNMSSYEVMVEMAKNLKLGFSTNISSTDDKMNWLNIGISNNEFIQDTTAKSYKSDSNFFKSFIDYYYNLTFVDVETQLRAEIEKQKGVTTTSHITVGEPESQFIEDLYLTTYNSGATGNNVIENYTMLNKSTKVSLNNGYRTELYYYDRTGNWKQKAGSFVKFSIETNTDGKGIIMKSDISDTKPTGFFNSNIKKVYLNPLDIDNTHAHYNYAEIINKYNNAELDKISMMVTLKVPNFNLYKFQKIKVIIYHDRLSSSPESLLNKRLSGGWLITSINFTYTQEEGLKQHMKMIKREITDKNFSY